MSNGKLITLVDYKGRPIPKKVVRTLFRSFHSCSNRDECDISFSFPFAQDCEHCQYHEVYDFYDEEE